MRLASFNCIMCCDMLLIRCKHVLIDIFRKAGVGAQKR